MVNRKYNDKGVEKQLSGLGYTDVVITDELISKLKTSFYISKDKENGSVKIDYLGRINRRGPNKCF